MKYMKVVPSSKPDQKFDLIEIEKEEHIAECLIKLIEQGIREDRHLFGQDWLKLDSKDLKEVLVNDTELDKILQYAKEGIKEQLTEALEDLEEEGSKQQLMQENIEYWIEKAVECYSGHALNKATLKAMVMKLSKGSVAPAKVTEIINEQHHDLE